MAIIYNPNKKIFTLHTAHTTYQMQVDPLGYLLHLYYGEKTNSSMDYVLTYADRGFSGNPYAAGMDRTYSLDALPQEYPSLGTGDYRNIALNIKNEKGVESADLLFKSYEIRNGKYRLQGLPAVLADEKEAQTLEIVLADENAQVEVHLLYGVLEENDVITRSVWIKNTGTGQITIEKAAAACLDFVQGDFDVLRFYGKHAMERNLERTPLGHGTIAFGSRRGTSSHQYNPAVILAEKGTTETAGSCYGMLFVYCGNFSCEAEKDQFNQTRLLLGLNEELFSYPLAAGETFTVPEVILSYSAEGLSALSQQYHNCIRNHVCRSKYVHMQRPVLINSWEAAYFDFTGDTIVALAKEAAADLENAFASNAQIITFPAGMVSRKTKGVIIDPEWQKSFIVKAVKYQRDIVPIHVKGENSKFFYNLANFRKKIGLKVNLEMMCLPKETFNKKGSTFTLSIGKPIPWETFDKSKTPKEWAAEVKKNVYSL